MSFGIFEAAVSSDDEVKLARQGAADKLNAAIYDVREKLGPFLFAANSLEEFRDRVALCKNDQSIYKIIGEHLHPGTGTVRRIAGRNGALEREFRDIMAAYDDGDNPYEPSEEEVRAAEEAPETQAWREDNRRRWENHPDPSMRPHTADFSGTVDVKSTFTPSDGKLEPEGDFQGYLNSVDQGAEGKVKKNFASRTAINLYSDWCIANGMSPQRLSSLDAYAGNHLPDDEYFRLATTITAWENTHKPKVPSTKLKGKDKVAGQHTAAPDYLQKADDALTQLLNQKAEEFQQTIAPLQQALITVQQAEQLQQQQNPLNVLPPPGTVNVLPGGGGPAQMGQAGGAPGTADQLGMPDPNAPDLSAAVNALANPIGAPAGGDAGAGPGGPPPAAAGGGLPPELDLHAQKAAGRGGGQGKGKGATRPHQASVFDLWQKFVRRRGDNLMRGDDSDYDDFANQFGIGQRAIQKLKQQHGIMAGVYAPAHPDEYYTQHGLVNPKKMWNNFGELNVHGQPLTKAPQISENARPYQPPAATGKPAAPAGHRRYVTDPDTGHGQWIAKRRQACWPGCHENEEHARKYHKDKKEAATEDPLAEQKAYDEEWERKNPWARNKEWDTTPGASRMRDIKFRQRHQGQRKQAWSGWGPAQFPKAREVTGWKWDNHLNGYLANKPLHFACECGNSIPTPSGFQRCACGKQWNSYVIGTGGNNREASAEKYLMREIPVRRDVIVAGKHDLHDEGGQINPYSGEPDQPKLRMRNPDGWDEGYGEDAAEPFWPMIDPRTGALHSLIEPGECEDGEDPGHPTMKSTPSDWHHRDKNQRWTK